MRLGLTEAWDHRPLKLMARPLRAETRSAISAASAAFSGPISAR